MITPNKLRVGRREIRGPGWDGLHEEGLSPPGCPYGSERSRWSACGLRGVTITLPTQPINYYRHLIGGDWDDGDEGSLELNDGPIIDIYQTKIGSYGFRGVLSCN